MHFDVFDSYLPAGSRVHGLDPRTKILGCVLFITSAVLLPDGSWAGFGVFWLCILASSVLAKIHPSALLKRSLVAAPFALAALSLPLTRPGDAVAVWELGRINISISGAGLVQFSSIVLRSWLAVQAAVILTATTQFPDLIHGLRHLRVPGLITGVLSFMYRYLFLLGDEALRLMRARAARSAAPIETQSRPPLSWRSRVAGGMVAQLFVRSLERSDRVYQAMRSRGYRGELLTMNPHEMKSSDWLALGVVCVLILIPHMAA